MNIFNIINFIINHPLNSKSKLKSFFLFVKWQIASRILEKPVIHDFTLKSKIILHKGMSGATGNLYCGLHEFSEMGFLLHYLKENDEFVDIGANIGSYSILASAHCRAKTLSIEPHPKTFAYLEENIAINKIGNLVKLENIAVGSQKNKLYFTNDLDTTNHISLQKTSQTIEVSVETLDNLLQDKKFSPSLIKIDVEGYETEVLNGALLSLKNKNLKVIIIELNGSGNKYGYDENKIQEKLTNYGFVKKFYNPLDRTFVDASNSKFENYIFIRDFDNVKQRIESASLVNINGILF